MHIRAHIAFEVIGDDGNVILCVQSPLDESAAVALQAGNNSTRREIWPPGAAPRQSVVQAATVAVGEGVEEAPSRPDFKPLLPVIDLRMSAEEMEDMAACNVDMRPLRSPEPPRPVPGSLRPGGDPRMRISTTGAAPSENGLTDGQGNPIQPAAKRGAKKRAAHGETPIAGDASGDMQMA